jgi:hypothetical protein
MKSRESGDYRKDALISGTTSSVMGVSATGLFYTAFALGREVVLANNPAPSVVLSSLFTAAAGTVTAIYASYIAGHSAGSLKTEKICSKTSDPLDAANRLNALHVTLEKKFKNMSLFAKSLCGAFNAGQRRAIRAAKSICVFEAEVNATDNPEFPGQKTYKPYLRTIK